MPMNMIYWGLYWGLIAVEVSAPDVLPGTSTAEQKNLLNLAVARFGPLRLAEEHLVRSVATGTVASFRVSGGNGKDENESNDPGSSSKWGPERAVRGRLVAWLCTGREASLLVTHRGVAIEGVRVDGGLDLQFARLAFPLYLKNCALTGLLNVQGANLHSLYLQGSYLKGLRADGLRVKGDVFLRDGFKCQGEVRLLGSDIEGNLDCKAGQFLNRGGIAIFADRMKVGGSFSLASGFRADGEVRLSGAVIAGQMRADGARLDNPNGTTLYAAGVRVGGGVFLKHGFRSAGTVVLVGASIDGHLDLTGATVFAPDLSGRAIFGDGLTASDVLLRHGFSARGEVRLANAVVRGQLDCTDAHFLNSKGFSLNLDGVSVERAIFFVSSPKGAGFRSEGELRLPGARIGGLLGCLNGKFLNPSGKALLADGVRVGSQAVLKSEFEGEVRLSSASVHGNVDLTGASLKRPNGVAFTGDRLEAKAILLQHAKVEGQIRIPSAVVGDKVECDGARIIAPGKVALNADALRTGGSVFLRNKFVVDGEVKLIQARIGGQLDCTKGSFRNPGKYALNCDGIKLDASFYFEEGSKAEGEVRFVGGFVSGDFSCEGGRISQPAGRALNAERLQVGGNMFLRKGFHARGWLDLTSLSVKNHLILTDLSSPEEMCLVLRSARVAVLWDDQASWPPGGKLVVDNFVYDTIDPRAPTDVARRLDWLGRQAHGPASSQPYEHLQALYKRMGRSREADAVHVAQKQIEKEGGLLNWLTAFGTEPWYLPLTASIVCVSVGCLMFRRRIMRESKGLDKNVEAPPLAPAASNELASVKVAPSGDVREPFPQPVVLVTRGGPQGKESSKGIGAGIDSRREYSWKYVDPLWYTVDRFVPFVRLQLEEDWSPDPRTLWGWLALQYSRLLPPLGWTFVPLFAVLFARSIYFR
jgi:hypothetical protein